MTKITNTQKLAALNAFRVANGQKSIAKYKPARHDAELKAFQKAAAPKGVRVSMSHAPASEVKPLRKGSNQAILATLMARAEGVTMDVAVAEINKARQAKDSTSSTIDKSVIGATISYDLVKVKGYGARAEVVDGVPTYFLVLPKGVDAPVVK